MDTAMVVRLGFIVLGLLLSGCVTAIRVPSEEHPTEEVAASTVGWDTFRPDWLASAVFAETNRLRVENDLPPLRSHRNLRGAADLQVITIALLGEPSHRNPLAGRTNVFDRVGTQGIDATAAWENIAVTYVREWGINGAESGADEPGEDDEMLDNPQDKRLEWPTYGQLASRIVEQWMNSPAHRENILRREPTFLGCGAALSRGPWGREIVYSIQVFMTKTHRVFAE